MHSLGRGQGILEGDVRFLRPAKPAVLASSANL
jgi:hypothetical protein